MHFLSIVIALILIGIFWPVLLGLFMTGLTILVVIGAGVAVYHFWGQGSEQLVIGGVGIFFLCGAVIWLQNTVDGWNAAREAKVEAKIKAKIETKTEPHFDEEVERMLGEIKLDKCPHCGTYGHTH
jgi:hypothetical protein